MCTLYETILRLCKSSSVKPGKMCDDLGLSRGLPTDLKMGRKKSISAVTANKIANYFGVTVNELLSEYSPEENRTMCANIEALRAQHGGFGTLMTPAPVANEIKNGTYCFTLETATQFADAFGVTIGDLLSDGKIVAAFEALDHAKDVRENLQKNSPVVPDKATLHDDLLALLITLTPDEIEKVDAFVQGLIASRKA